MGARPFRPTKTDRESVVLYLGMGIPIEAVHLLITNPKTGKPIGLNTLKKYFAREILTGRIRYYVFVTGKLHQRIAAGDMKAISLWLAAQGGWSLPGGAPEIPLAVARAMEMVKRSERTMIDVSPAGAEPDDDDLAPGRLARAYYDEAQAAAPVLDEAQAEED